MVAYEPSSFSLQGWALILIALAVLAVAVGRRLHRATGKRRHTFGAVLLAALLVGVSVHGHKPDVDVPATLQNVANYMGADVVSCTLPQSCLLNKKETKLTVSKAGQVSETSVERDGDTIVDLSR